MVTLINENEVVRVLFGLLTVCAIVWLFSLVTKLMEWLVSYRRKNLKLTVAERILEKYKYDARPRTRVQITKIIDELLSLESKDFSVTDSDWDRWDEVSLLKKYEITGYMINSLRLEAIYEVQMMAALGTVFFPSDPKA